MKTIFVIFGENSDETKMFCPTLFEMLSFKGINFSVIRVAGVDYQTALNIIKEKIDKVTSKIILYAGDNLENLKNETSIPFIKYDIAKTRLMMLSIATDSAPEKNQENAANLFSENLFCLCNLFVKDKY